VRTAFPYRIFKGMTYLETPVKSAFLGLSAAAVIPGCYRSTRLAVTLLTCTSLPSPLEPLGGRNAPAQ
jgi:hypothetical protein